MITSWGFFCDGFALDFLGYLQGGACAYDEVQSVEWNSTARFGGVLRTKVNKRWVSHYGRHFDLQHSRRVIS